MSELMELELRGTTFKNYSERQQRMFSILKSLNGEKIDTETLTRKFYKGKIPLHGRTIVSGLVNSLIEKVDYNKEPFRVRRSKPTGPIATYVWLTRR